MCEPSTLIAGHWIRPYHFPTIHVNCRVDLAHENHFELEFKQYSFNLAHLTLTVLR
jgi:hypothetical protein